jgi:hypothetical protein
MGKEGPGWDLIELERSVSARYCATRLDLHRAETHGV